MIVKVIIGVAIVLSLFLLSIFVLQGHLSVLLMEFRGEAAQIEPLPTQVSVPQITLIPNRSQDQLRGPDCEIYISPNWGWQDPLIQACEGMNIQIESAGVAQVHYPGQFLGVNSNFQVETSCYFVEPNSRNGFSVIVNNRRISVPSEADWRAAMHSPCLVDDARWTGYAVAGSTVWGFALSAGVKPVNLASAYYAWWQHYKSWVISIGNVYTLPQEWQRLR